MFDVNAIRKDFPMIVNNPDFIYLDSSATSFKPNCVLDTINSYYQFKNTNIHRGDYDISIQVSKAYDEVRNKVKDFIHASQKQEIIFTHGDTESLNTLAFGYALTHLKKGDVILTSMLEHASNILPLFVVAKKIGARIEYMPLLEDGHVDLNRLEECFHNPVKLVAITHVSNVLGYINPIEDICKIAHRHDAKVIVDAAQSVPHILVDVTKLDCDFLTFSSHKMLGPSGVGVLYGKMELLQELDPLMYGGGANARFDSNGNILLSDIPERFEAGTNNIEGVLGLGSAIDYLSSIGMENVACHDHELVAYFIERLSKCQNVELYNPKADCGIVSFNIKGVFAQDAASYFNSKKIAVRTGNHCAKILHNVIGVNESIRASMYLYNTKQEIDRFIAIIEETTLEKCVDSIL